MADLTITTANVVSLDGAQRKSGNAGETVLAGKMVYLDPTSQKWMLADSNSATPAARHTTGVALNGASNGQPLQVHLSGPITIGATLTPGLAYYLSDTPGGICLVADVGTGEYVCLIGLAASATALNVDIQFPNVAN